MKKVYILTGATGFLGALLAHKILERGDRIIFVGRPKKGVPLRERILEKLRRQQTVFNDTQVLFWESDLADLSKTKSAHLQNISKIDGIWHLAANLSFKDKDREKVFKDNLIATEQIIGLARELHCPLFFTSTAYVHGKRSGIIMEDSLVCDKFNNSYEESKCKAEQYVQDEMKKGLKAIVFRPGILLTDDEHSITKDFGFYTVTRAINELKKFFVNFKRKHKILSKILFIREMNGGLFVPLVFLNPIGCHIDLVPASWAVQWMLTLSSEPRAFGKTFHLSNPNPPEFSLIVKEMFAAVKIRMFIIPVSATGARIYFTLLKIAGYFVPFIAALNRKILPYSFYMIENTVHDMTNTALFIPSIKMLKLKSGALAQTAEDYLKQ